jgi:hypothetical protein
MNSARRDAQLTPGDQESTSEHLDLPHYESRIVFKIALYWMRLNSALPKKSLDEFMAKSLVLPLTVVSDGLGCFTVVAGQGAVHERTVTGGGKDSVKLPQFNAVNTLLGNLKTALTGTYHAVKFAKYAARYLGEVQYRFNRRYDLRSILARLVRAAVATPPLPVGVIRLAEHRC